MKLPSHACDLGMDEADRNVFFEGESSFGIGRPEYVCRWPIMGL